MARALERILDACAHAGTATALLLAARASRVANGLVRIPPEAPRAALPALSVIVPARDEERTIERCVRSLLAQTLDAEIIVVDDRSTDRTPEILATLQREASRVRVVRGEPLPDGWIGKPWALAQGVRAAHGEWLLFTDADSWHHPAACASVLGFAVDRGADAVTLGTYQELGTLGERATLPSVLGLILLACGSFEDLNDPRKPDAALANGQYILVRRAAYEALGGHAALRGAIVEDVGFARRLKADGRFRLLIAGGEHLVRVRMYDSLGAVWRGFTKNFYAGAEGNAGALAGAAAAMALLSVVPAALLADALVRRRPARAAEAALTVFTGAAVSARGLRMVQLPARLAAFAPFGYAFAGAVVVNSTLRVLSGRGVEWRGRIYTGRHDESERPPAAS